MSTILQEIEHCARRILQLQQADGRINWIDGGIFDPWNHSLCAMALQVAGYRDQAEAAFACLQDILQADGSLPGQCGASAPLDAKNRKLLPEQASDLTDTNFAAFPAMAIWHSFCLHRDSNWLQSQLELLDATRNFVLSHQSVHGEIAWRRKEQGETLEEIDALFTGNCSTYKSLLAARNIDHVFGNVKTSHEAAIQALHDALLTKPFRFDRTWPSKSRYAMDWYYPVLTGVFTKNQAKTHINKRFDEFVDKGFGCRCVADQPWTTTAETCELIMALLAVGQKERAKSLLKNLHPLRADQGGYWMGWQSEENLYWPEERPSWTAAAMILALDAVHKITPAHNVIYDADNLKDNPD